MDVTSELVDATLSAEHQYEFVYGKGLQMLGGVYISRQQRLAGDDQAKEYAAMVMAAEHTSGLGIGVDLPNQSWCLSRAIRSRSRAWSLG